jgi:hypothetical protein
MPFVHSAPGHLIGAVLGVIEHENCPRFGRVNHTQIGAIAHMVASPHDDLPHWPTQPGTEWHGTLESTTTADETQAHTTLWDRQVLQHFPGTTDKVSNFELCHEGQHPLNVIRYFLLRLWRKRICRSLLKFLHTPEGKSNYQRNIVVGKDCLVKAAGASWWEWLLGSTPFFWRWPQQTRTLMGDGHPPFFVSEPPRWIKPQRMEHDPCVREKVLSKLMSVIQKRLYSTRHSQKFNLLFLCPKGVR